MDSEEEFDKLSKPKIIKTDEGMMTLLVDTILRLEIKIDDLRKVIIPEMKDISKYLEEAKKLANKGKLPRQQPKSARQAFKGGI